MADRPNILSRQVGIAYMRGDFVIPGAGLFPSMQLFNPAASGVALLVDQVWVGSTRLVYIGSTVAVIAAPLIGNGISKLNFAAGLGEIYAGGLAALMAVATRMASKDISGTSAHPMIDGAPIQIEPGDGLLAQCGGAGGLGSFTFSWREQ